MELNFQISDESSRRFAGFTGDFSSIHMDPEFARQSRYRRPVLHGMFPIAFLSVIQSLFPEQRLRFKQLSGRFLNPFFAGEPVHMELNVERATSHFEAEWTSPMRNLKLATATGSFILDHQKTGLGIFDESGATSLVGQRLDEATHDLSSIAGQRAMIPFLLSESVGRSFADLLSSCILDTRNAMDYPQWISNELLVTMLVSTLVGMRLPGRRATFTDFHLAFSEEFETGKPYQLVGQVEKVFTASGRLQISCGVAGPHGLLAEGGASSLLTSTPSAPVTCTAVRNNHLGLGLEGKVILITGASRGIGCATAKLLAMLGASVVVHYFKGKADAESIVSEIAENGGRAIALYADNRSKPQVESLVKEVVAKWGTVNVLVNNAVHEFTPKALLETEWEDYSAEMDVSLRGMHEYCRQVIPLMKEKGRGKIINLSSLATEMPVNGQNKYITVKSALLGYTRSLAVELATHNIQANLVVPGMTDTSLLASIPQALIKRIEDEIPGAKLLQPIEVAQTIAFLSSRWSDGISGQRIVLNQGQPPFI